jgi:hypothetical protein
VRNVGTLYIEGSLRRGVCDVRVVGGGRDGARERYQTRIGR